MSEKMKSSGPQTTDAEARNHKRNGSAIPGVNIPELIEERNWTALAGLGLIVVGLLYVFQDWLGFDLNLWSIALLGMGGWLMFDAWQKYTLNAHQWRETDRNRMAGGAVIALVGLLGTFHLSGWGWFLLLVAGWLMFDSWQKYEQNGRVWTERTRTRMIGGAVIAFIGMFGLIHVWSTWPLILIILGGAMLFGYVGGKR